MDNARADGGAVPEVPTEEHVLRLFTLRLTVVASLALVAAANGAWKWELPLP
jgi:hypothetical protein